MDDAHDLHQENVQVRIVQDQASSSVDRDEYYS